MRKTIEFFVKYPIWANAIIFAVIIFGGIAAFFTIKKSFFPEFDPGRISISVSMPGASPEEMEEGVTLKIEESLKGVDGIDEMTSTSSENFASVSIAVLKNAEIDEVLTDVKNAVDGINSFPVSAEQPQVFKVKPRSRVLFMGLTGDVDLNTLKRFSQQIEDDLLASGVVSQVTISGYPVREISIEVPEAVLSRYGMTFAQVAAAVRNNNRDISAGSIKSEDEEILIRSRAKSKDADIIGDIILRANNDGSKLYLRDVATIKEQFADVPNQQYLNGKRSINFEVTKLPEEDIEEISDYCNEYVENFNAQYDVMKLEVTFDFLYMLKQRLSMLLENGGIGLLLVLVSLGLFLSLRLSFWVAAGIPISFMGMFFIASFFGITINMISLFGMILVVGILVDDGIVIAENIYSHFERGKSAYQAAVDGTVEVLPSVFTSVTTTIVAFTPLLVLEGFEFLQEMAIVVMCCLGFSLVEAFFVLPAHLASPKILERKERVSGLRKVLNRFIDFLREDVYGKALSHILEFRYIYITVPFVFIMIVTGLIQGGFIRTTFFPVIPFDQFQVDIALKAGTPEEEVKKYLTVFEEQAWELNKELKEETQDSVDFISYTFTFVGGTSDGSESGSHAGNVAVLLNEMDNRDSGISAFDIRNRLKKKIGDIPEAEKFYMTGANRFGKPVSISLLSKNSEELEMAKEDLKAELENIAMLRDVADNVKLGRRELQLDLLPKSYFLGLTHADITTQIRQGFFGEEVQRLQKGNDEVRVWVRYPKTDRLSLGQLEEMKVKTTGNEYPLTELANYKIQRGVVDIKHYNGAREVKIEADLEDPNASSTDILANVQEEIVPRLKAKYAGLEVVYGGQQRRSSRSVASLMQVLPPLLFTIIILITLTFRSLSQTLMVISMIPLGVFCSFVGHGIEGKPVSILSMWGILALSGVIINDAVVLMAKYNQNLKEGFSVLEAAHHAGKSRFRAIMLTSLTTVAGLYPLILEKSFQAQFLIPMAISVAYGVLFGTLFILLIFPVLIVVVNDFRRSRKYFFHWVKCFWNGNYTSLEFPSREEVEPSIREIKRINLNKEAA